MDCRVCTRCGCQTTTGCAHADCPHAKEWERVTAAATEGKSKAAPSKSPFVK